MNDGLQDSHAVVEALFQDDEQTLRKPDPGVDPEALLRQDGVYFLKDVVPILAISNKEFRSQVEALERQGQDVWAVMGARKVWRHWMVRMKVFADYYRAQLAPRWQSVPDEWDGNRLMSAKGVFRMSDVVRKIPFSANQIRHKAKTLPDARRIMGVWKDERASVYLVDMAVFAPWVARLWRESEPKGPKK